MCFPMQRNILSIFYDCLIDPHTFYITLLAYPTVQNSLIPLVTFDFSANFCQIFVNFEMFSFSYVQVHINFVFVYERKTVYLHLNT